MIYMRKWLNKGILILFAVMFLLGFSGCTKGNETEYKVYYTNNTKTKLVNKTIKTKDSDALVTVNKLLQEMNVNQKQDDYAIIKPENVNISGTRIDSSTACIYFSKEYNDMNSTVELLYRSAVVKMLTQIDGVDYVRFYVDSNPAEYSDGTQIGLMSESDFVDDSNDKIGDIKWVNLNLYYSNKLGDKLAQTTVSVAYNKSISLERMVVEKLINGPMNTSLGATLPSDLKLLSISQKNGICYVNLSSTFLTEMVNVQNEIPIYSIVNSLCELDTVNAVKIMINGDSNNTFRESISLDNTFEFNPDLIEK